MAEQRLIDANSLKVLFEHEYRHNKQFKQSSVWRAWQGAIQLLYDQPTIDPETLPIVQQLRKELAKVTAERDAAVSDLEDIMAYNSDTCQLCENNRCYVRGGTKPCFPKWRGPQKEEDQ